MVVKVCSPTTTRGRASHHFDRLINTLISSHACYWTREYSAFPYLRLLTSSNLAGQSLFVCFSRGYT